MRAAKIFINDLLELDLLDKVWKARTCSSPVDVPPGQDCQDKLVRHRPRPSISQYQLPHAGFALDMDLWPQQVSQLLEYVS